MIFPLIISNTGDMNKNWMTWKNCFLMYMNLHDYTDKSEEEKIELLRRMIGSDALNVPLIFHIVHNTVHKNLNTFTLTRVLERLDDFFHFMKNELVERYTFFNRFQQKDESIEMYILDLKEKAKTCNFGSLTDSIIRDKVIANLHNKDLRLKLFQTLNLDLVTLLNICKVYESENRNNNGTIVEKKQTKTKHRDNVAIVAASNSTNKKVAEKTQISNKKENTNINDKTKLDLKNMSSGSNITGTTCQRNSSSNNKTMTHPKSDNSGNNIVNTSCRRNSNTNSKTTADTKIDNSNINITDTACQQNSNIHDKTKLDLKNMSSGSNITGTTCQRNSSSNNKTMTHPKSDNSGNNIVNTSCRRNSNTNSKTTADTKIDNSNINITDTACQQNSNIHDKTKQDFKNMNSGNNITGTTYRRNSNSNSKTVTFPKSDNSGNNIVDTSCRRNSNSSSKINTVPKIDSSDRSLIDFKENYINDNTKIDSKCVNSNHSMNMARQNTEISGTQYRRNCWRCNEKHAQRCCPAWGHKCENCGERNHFTSCCKMKSLRREKQHINMISKENASSHNTIQYENALKPIAPSNYNVTADIGSRHIPSAPEFGEIENELYPNLQHMSPFSISVPLDPEARIDNTESKTAATESPNLKRRSSSGKDACSVS